MPIARKASEMKKFVQDHQVVMHFACYDNCLCCGEKVKMHPCDVPNSGIPICSEGQQMSYVGTEVEHPAFKACNILVDAYSNGEEAGGSINWQQVDDAYAVAVEALVDAKED